MSSFVRRIERQVCPSKPVHPIGTRYGRVIYRQNPPREVFYQGRGSKLGVSNPKDKSLLARLRREERNRERRAAE